GSDRLREKPHPYRAENERGVWHGPGRRPPRPHIRLRWPGVEDALPPCCQYDRGLHPVVGPPGLGVAKAYRPYPPAFRTATGVLGTRDRTVAANSATG